MSHSLEGGRRLNRQALISFLLGLSSLAGLFFVTGVPAMILGLRGLRAINSNEEQWRGARLAIAGMALGLAGTVVTLLGLGTILALRQRASNNRVECIEHLHQIGLALNRYADAHKSFPPAARGPDSLAPERRVSWIADIVPLLQEGTPRNKPFQDLARKIDHSKAWDDPVNAKALATPVRLFLCPGDPDFEPDRSPGLTNYVGIAGINPGAEYLSRDDPRAGMFGYDRGVREKEVTAGTSNTMMVVETEEKGLWLAGGHPTVRGLDPDEKDYIGPGRPFGGLHRGIANVLCVDGSVEPRSENVAPELFRWLALPKRSDEPGE
jgi:hypothetical protein